ATSNALKNLIPEVVSGPIMIENSLPGHRYTLLRNPSYYRASEGLPYLDNIIFRIVLKDVLLKDLQAGAIDSSSFLNDQIFQQYLNLTKYSLVTSPTTASFEGIYFNFHNTVLASHPEVREAIAKAIDSQSLIAAAP